MIIEINHKYLDEPINSEDRFNLLLLKKMVRDNEEQLNDILILLDDIHIKEPILNSEILKNMYQSEFPSSNIHVIYESELKVIADMLFTTYFQYFTKREYFRRDKKYVDFFIVEGKKIPLRFIKENESDYTCAFYSLAFALYKYSNFNTVGISVLNNEFKTIEENVILLAKEINLQIDVNSNYYFY